MTEYICVDSANPILLSRIAKQFNNLLLINEETTKNDPTVTKCNYTVLDFPHLIKYSKMNYFGFLNEIQNKNSFYLEIIQHDRVFDKYMDHIGIGNLLSNIAYMMILAKEYDVEDFNEHETVEYYYNLFTYHGIFSPKIIFYYPLKYSHVERILDKYPDTDTVLLSQIDKTMKRLKSKSLGTKIPIIEMNEKASVDKDVVELLKKGFPRKYRYLR